MKLLWVATKSPYPPRDGGRLALGLTLEALRAAGHELTLLAPDLGQARSGREAEGCLLVPARPRSWPAGLAVSLLAGVPLTVARHTLPAVRRAVAQALRRQRYDVVVAEQLQALPQCDPAFERGLPVVLRAQNVESDLWARQRGGWSALLALESRRLARHEAAALRRVAMTLALTAADASRLRALAEGARVESVAAPFPGQLPPGSQPLDGSPALVILAGAGWRPNDEGVRWFVDSVWPLLHAAHAQARLHVFGTLDGGPSVQVHPAPPDSAAAFPRGSIHVVPLQVASGVRMKVLEAWARGVPVIATTAAAAGLEARSGKELLLADDAPGFAAALARLTNEPGLAGRLIAAGRATLASRHDPQAVAARWTELLEQAATRR